MNTASHGTEPLTESGLCPAAHLPDVFELPWHVVPGRRMLFAVASDGQVVARNDLVRPEEYDRELERMWQALRDDAAHRSPAHH